MRVKLDIGLDFNGLHTFEWAPADIEAVLSQNKASSNGDAQTGIEVPRALLERWTHERDAFRLAAARWKHVAEEIEEHLFRMEQARLNPSDGEG